MVTEMERSKDVHASKLDSTFADIYHARSNRNMRRVPKKTQRFQHIRRHFWSTTVSDDFETTKLFNTWITVEIEGRYARVF